MANEKELNPSPKFPTGVKPELSPNPNFSDGLENKTSEKANTQIVNESKVQPIKNLTAQQIIELIQKYAPGFDPSSVEAGELISALGLDEDGLLKKQALAGLFDGKYVRIMDAPTSTTLTAEEVAQMEEGVFTKGNSSLLSGSKNDVYFPFYSLSSNKRGIAFLCNVNGSQGIIGVYGLNSSTKKLTLVSKPLMFNNDGSLMINEKVIPAYPANTGSFTLKCVNGTLTWVQDA